MKSLPVKAYAKINLGLVVLGQRPDGFHEIRTIYQTISLADRIEVRLRPGAGSVHLETSGFPVPDGRQNLAVQAAERMLEELGRRWDVRIRLDKQIPPASGLGGASSDAAAVMRALLCLSDRRLAWSRLLHLAAGLGSDVPFFLLGGRAVGVGRGEEVYALPDGPKRHLVVVAPENGMETAEAYRRLRRPLLTTHRVAPTIELFCASARATDWNGLRNDFEPVAFRAVPSLAGLKAALLEAGARSVLLAGSGSAIFGVFDSAEAARRAARQMQPLARHAAAARTLSRREFDRSFGDFWGVD